MRIRSSTIESHRFTVVRRRGYEPAEVDAAMGRLANTLREYEALTEELEVKLREADDASEAIHRTFVAAQQTRDEMIAEAKKEAAHLLDSACAQADDIVDEAATAIDALLAKASADADGLYAAATAARACAVEDTERARAEADEILESAKAQAEAARAEADEVLTSAIADAETTTEEANHVLSNHLREAEATLRDAEDEAARLTEAAKVEAEQLAKTATAEAETDAAERISTAQSQSDEILHLARARAEAIVEKAQRNADQLQRRAAQLRTAVGDIERELRKLAATTLERTDMIGEMIALEHLTIDLTDSGGDTTADLIEANVTPGLDHGPDLERSVALAETTATDTIGGPVGLATVIESTDAVDGKARRRSELEALAQLVRARTVAFAEPDGSGRPPAARRLLDPENPQHGGNTPKTIYQRRTKGLRARLREEGQDPTQRGR